MGLGLLGFKVEIVNGPVLCNLCLRMDYLLISIERSIGLRDIYCKFEAACLVGGGRSDARLPEYWLIHI